MNKPRMIGSINCYWPSEVTFKGKKVGYNGTTLGLVKALIAHGAAVDDQFIDDARRSRKVIAVPHDKRANGLWVTSWNLDY